jgi:flagellar biosynthesis protein FlhB
MELTFNLLMSFLHFAMTYIFFITILISNDIKILLILLVIMSIIKFFYYFFGRCVVTLYEQNNHFSTMAELFSNTLTTNLAEKKTEEILINVGVLIILNKLLVLIFYNYYLQKKRK